MPKHGRKFEQRLRAVWEHGTPIGSTPDPTPWRYVPKSLTGGTGWGVFDRLNKRFVEDADLLRLPVDVLSNELLKEELQ